MRRPHIGCGTRISYTETAYWMRSPHIICGDRILDAAPEYHIRRPHIVYGARISYAATAYCMRHPNTIFGDRILYAAPAYHMRRPHIVCGSPIYFPEPHAKMWNPQRSQLRVPTELQRNCGVSDCSLFKTTIKPKTKWTSSISSSSGPP